MTKEEFARTPFHPGIRAETIYRGRRNIFEVTQSDFESYSVFDPNGNEFLLEQITKFHPPKDYSPCMGCGAIHHPHQNTLCKR